MYFLIVLLVVLPLFASFIYTNRYHKPAIFESEYEQLHAVSQSVGFDLSRQTDSVKTTILLIAELANLHNWIESDETDDIELNHTLSVFHMYGTNMDNIAQLRYINSTGYERIRYNISNNRSNSIISLIKEEDLQYKGQRDYYIDSSIISKGEIYISHINLNIENQVIEYEDGHVVPVIRYATPVYIDSNYEGIILVNFYYEPIYNQRLQIVNEFYEKNDVAIIDNNGYFLFSNFNTGWSAKENLNTNVTFNNYFNEVEITKIDREFSHVKLKNRLAVLHTIDIEFSDNLTQLSFFLSVSRLQITENIDETMNLIYLFVIIVLVGSIPIVYALPINRIDTICAVCKKIRNPHGHWISVEQYIQDKSDVKFSHGYCPECYQDQLDSIHNTM